MITECPHVKDHLKVLSTTKHVCEDCVKSRDHWVHLRMCTECGYVGCCDSSVNRHATKHFHATGHPIIRSAEPGEGWLWCYVDEEELGELAA